MTLILKRTGFGLSAAIIALGTDTQALAFNITPNNSDRRQITVMASVYAQPATAADLPACFSRLVAWAGDEPTDNDEVLLDPLSAYFGQLPGRALLDVMVPALRPFCQEMTFVVEPQESLWIYLGNCRHAITLDEIQAHISLGVVNRDSGGLGTQGLKAV